MENIQVSIITVCHNSEGTIRDTINSILRQTYHNLEYIIIDGKSDDRTMDIVREYRQAFAERNMAYRYLSEPDNGMYDAMNKGIRMASGELVGIINSDDWYEPDAVAVAARCYEKAPYDLFYADLRIIGCRITEYLSKSERKSGMKKEEVGYGGNERNY